MSIHDICVSLDISKKALKMNVDNANELFFPISLQKNGKNELKLVIPKNYSIGHIYKCLHFESKEFKILEKIFLSETYSVDDLANEMYISSSSLRRVIKFMNVVLKEEEIKIKLNPLRVRGNEVKIINFYIHFLIERYPLKKPIFNTEQINAVGDLVSYLANKNNVVLDYFTEDRLKVFALVQLTRLKNDQSLKKIDQLDTSTDFTMPNFFSILKKLENSFHIVCTEQLLLELFDVFLDGRYSFNYMQLKQSSLINPKIKETLQKFKTLFDLIMIEFSIELSELEREKLIVNLCNIAMFQYGKSFILYDDISDLVEHFYNSYPEGVQFIKDTIKELFKNEVIEEYELNNYIYALIPHFSKYFSEMERQSLPLSIGIVYDTNAEHIKLLQDEIEYRFKKKFSTTIITDPHDIEKILTQEEQYDVIMTNFSEFHIAETEVLCFSGYPKEKEWSELLDYYNRVKLSVKYQNE